MGVCWFFAFLLRSKYLLCCRFWTRRLIAGQVTMTVVISGYSCMKADLTNTVNHGVMGLNQGIREG